MEDLFAIFERKKQKKIVAKDNNAKVKN